MLENQAFALLKWTEQHHQGQGKFVSNAHHPIWGVANSNLLPHTFHYYGLILSYLNLYRRLGKESYLQKAKQAGDFLCSLQRRSGQYRYDTFEFNMKTTTGLTLIHNALPSIALLQLYKITKKEHYKRTARKNIAWWYCRLWNGHYLTGCINQDVCAAEALAHLYELDNKVYLRRRAEQIADTSLTLQQEEGACAGGFIRGFNEPDLIIPWYDALTAVAYEHMSTTLNKEEYHTSAVATAKFIKKNLTRDGLVHWYIKKDEWKKETQPLLTAPAGIALQLLDQLKMSTPSLLHHQQKDGSFPLSYWYTDERASPNIGWNQFMLMYLTSKVNKEKEVRIAPNSQKATTRRSQAQGIQVKIYTLAKEGYVDVIKNHFTLKTYPIHGRIGTINEKEKDDVTLRIRMRNTMWRTIKPNKRFLKVVALPYVLTWPYRAFNGAHTRILMALFQSPLLEKMSHGKWWRK